MLAYVNSMILLVFNIDQNPEEERTAEDGRGHERTGEGNKGQFF